jgi:uncharacterized protein YcbX
VRVLEIWRYPVKSMAGELLESADLTEAGIVGDRLIQVRNPSGRIMTARTRPLLLRHRATTGPDQQVLVDGRPWSDFDVEPAAGKGTRLIASDTEDRFDILPLLVATDGMLQAVGYDRRRFRPNLVISGVAGLTERNWEGARLRIGPVIIGLADLRARCIMTTFDPDSGEQDVEILRRVQRDFDGRLGLNATVQTPGRIHRNDEVVLLPS